MMNTTNNLELLFKDASGVNKKISLRNPKLDLTPQQAKDAVETIVAAEIFNGKNGNPYAEAVGARYVKRTVEDLFEVVAP
ncbi:DUF2922 domain-containing protein [Aerococcaceae bacterium WGS1372]